MSVALVVAESDAVGMREAGDSALVIETIGAPEGSETLTQRVLRFGPGRSQPRVDIEHDELLYVVSGTGAVAIDGQLQGVARGTACHVIAGEAFTAENPGDEELVLVSVLVPATDREQLPPEARQAVVRLEDRPEQRADEKRTYRVLFGADTGCPNATQFVGYVEPYRAPDHSHPYDEVGYVLAGTGFAHLGGAPIPIGAGSCFRLPREHVHCIENTGPGVMEILGVFHPAESPAARSYDAAPTEPATAASRATVSPPGD
jgi:mannose-6-phosphate isomerase-like protein (cupin superfamily)